MLQNLHGAIADLIRILPLLESLALTYCSVTDANLTGLEPRAVFDIQRCLTTGLAVINAGG
jgi:hypothetical protein